VRGRNTKGMVMVLFSFVAVPTCSALTLSDTDGFWCGLPSRSHPNPRCRLEMGQITGPSDSHLISVAAEFHKPAVRFRLSPGPLASVKSLPPVPQTLLMVAIGLLCVLLAKDRMVCLGAFGALVWAGQAGISFLPQFTSNLAGKRQSGKRSYSLHVTRLWERKHRCRPRSDIEGKHYIGLLRRLAGIPNGTVPSLSPVFLPSLPAKRAFVAGRDRTQRNLSAPGNRLSFEQTGHRFRLLELAVGRLSSLLIHASNCLAIGTRQRAYFSIGFVIVNSARGPPYRVQTREPCTRTVNHEPIPPPTLSSQTASAWALSDG
jgi:hypothetical protein